MNTIHIESWGLVKLSSQTPESKLIELIIKLRDEYIQGGSAPNAYEINNGLCVEFASDIENLARDIIEGVYEVDCYNFMIGYNGEEEDNDVWDRELLRTHWGIDLETMSCNVDSIAFGHHCWVTYNGKHYDAECPEGVRNFFDLPLYRRSIEFALTEPTINPDI